MLWIQDGVCFAELFLVLDLQSLHIFSQEFWQHLGHTWMHFSHLLLSFFLKTRGVVLPQGFLFLMQQGNPHLDHNDRSSLTARLESECPFLKPCMMGYYGCVCVPARLSADSYATVPWPCYSRVWTLTPSCHSQRALSGHWVCYIYLRGDCGWMFILVQ